MALGAPLAGQALPAPIIRPLTPGIAEPAVRPDLRCRGCNSREAIGAVLCAECGRWRPLPIALPILAAQMLWWAAGRLAARCRRRARRAGA
jgi:hypothetical protein